MMTNSLLIRKTSKTAQILSLVCCVPLWFFGCGSKSREPNPQAKKGDGINPGQGRSADENVGAQAPWRWLSDVDQVFIEPCQVGQVMVNAECWDEVHFKPTGVALSRPGATLPFFENGSFPNDYIKSQYVYADDSEIRLGERAFDDLPRKTFGSLGDERIFDWFFNSMLNHQNYVLADDSALMQVRFGTLYNFAPSDLSFSLPREDRILDRARLAHAEFLLVLSGDYAEENGVFVRHAWRVKGTLEICGKILKLESITQGDIEKTCATGPKGTISKFKLPIQNGWMIFDFSNWRSAPTDDQPGAIIYDLNFPDPSKVTPAPNNLFAGTRQVGSR